MFVRVGQYRFMNPNTMVYSFKKLLLANMELYKKEGLKSVTVIRNGEDKLSYFAIWEKKPSDKVFEKLDKNYKEHSKQHEFQIVTGSGSVELLWTQENEWEISNE
tara:strand:+ start:209 stop:523 length:315 start_codon:yes stop_codon:yes gene_type:complete